MRAGFVLLLIAAVVAAASARKHHAETPIDAAEGAVSRVTFDGRSLLINDKRFFGISGSLHYARSSPLLWDHLMNEARANGLNTIVTDVFWNLHEPRRGKYNFEGRADLASFLQKAADHGLKVVLRVGPYVSSEWAYGGFPAWLRDLPGVQLRTYNSVYIGAVENWLRKLSTVVEPYLSKNGGPVIMAQIEEDYEDKGKNADKYLEWCGTFTLSLAWEVPWVMNNGRYATSTIETAEGCQAADWVEEHWKRQPDRPALWLDNNGGFETWGVAPAVRDASDLSLSIADFAAVGGSFHNYAVWYGGNNFETFAGDALTTQYANDAVLRSSGVRNEPKFTHVRNLHQVLSDYSDAILSQSVPPRTPLRYWNGTQFVTGDKTLGARVYANSTTTIAFLECLSDQPRLVQYRMAIYELHPGSMTIIDVGLDKELFSTHTLPPTVAKRSGEAGQMVLAAGAHHHGQHRHHRQQKAALKQSLAFQREHEQLEALSAATAALKWRWSYDHLFPGNNGVPSQRASMPVEQLKMTNMASDYCWYRRNISLSSLATEIFVTSASNNALLLFLDGKFVAEVDNHGHGQPQVLVTKVPGIISPESHLLEILSVSLGVENTFNSDNWFVQKGITGDVIAAETNLTVGGQWEMQPQLAGQFYKVFTPEGASVVHWNDNLGPDCLYRPLIWFQTSFELPPSVDPRQNAISVDVSGMYRGHLYVNGFNIGRYWLIPGSCSADKPSAAACTAYDTTTCAKPTQTVYHIPADVLVPGENTLTILEEIGGDPDRVKIVVTPF